MSPGLEPVGFRVRLGRRNAGSQLWLGRLRQLCKNVHQSQFAGTAATPSLLFCLIPLCLLLGLGLAALMDQGLRETAVFRTLILLPFALSFVVTGTVWAYMYRPTGGVLNSFLSILGVDVAFAMKNGHLMWASSNKTIMLSIIIAMVWQFSGYVAVIFHDHQECAHQHS